MLMRAGLRTVLLSSLSVGFNVLGVSRVVDDIACDGGRDHNLFERSSE
jgi:hypothetical protein